MYFIYTPIPPPPRMQKWYILAAKIFTYHNEILN